MLRLLLSFFFVIHSTSIYCSAVYIRSFDLGGGGLKTALFRYDAHAQDMVWVEPAILLHACPDGVEVSVWIRARLKEVKGIELDDEIAAGYYFTFSLAGLSRLKNGVLPYEDVSVLFRLPPDRVRCIDDGAAHLISSLHSKDLHLPRGVIWNFSIGTAIGWGFTDSNHQVRNFVDLWNFFGNTPWHVKESRTGEDIWIACSGKYGLEQLIKENKGIGDDKVFLEFAARWKGYIENSIIDCAKKKNTENGFKIPSAIIFTGGVVDMYGERFLQAIQYHGMQIPVMIGPKQAGLLGAAWNSVMKPFGSTPLIKAVARGKCELVKRLLCKGVDVNQKDALGYTALDMAIKKNAFSIVKLLVKYGANVNEIDFHGRRPLFYALQHNPQIANFLIQSGAYVEYNAACSHRLHQKS